VGAAERQVAPLNDELRALAFERGDHGLQRRQVAVNVGDEREPHRASVVDGG
jgi:hypothetical protein